MFADWRIGTQLKVGLGVIVAMVVALVVLAAWQCTLLFDQTRGLYEHPLQVRAAVGQLKADVLSIHRDMKSLFVANDQQQIEAALQSINVAVDDADHQFAVLHDRYLGSSSDIERAEQEFDKWDAIRAETARLLQTGERDVAAARTMPDGAGDRQAQAVLEAVATISDFAAARADRFYADAQAQHTSLLIQLGLIGGLVVVATLVISWLLVRRIRRPLADLQTATERFHEGDLGARSAYSAHNEFGDLAASFNAMAGGIETRTRLSADAADLAGVMLREDELQAFCRGVLESLMEHTGSQAAAVYLLSADGTALEHFESIGLSPDARHAFSVDDLEGELGAAVASRRINRTTLPEGTRFVLLSTAGEFVPREMIAVPVVSEDRVVAAVSLVSVRAYTEADLQLVEDVWSVLTARLNGVLVFRQVRDFAMRLEEQNAELESQKRELAAQGDELTEQNTALERQTEELERANRLKTVFLSNMSHELRTPLNSVIALSGVLSRRLEGAVPDEEYGYLEVIERNGKNLLALINDILDLSRIESGREEVRPDTFSLVSLLEEVVETIRPQADEKHIDLTLSAEMGPSPIVSDLTKVRHILTNIVGNAVKFTDEGAVQVRVRRKGHGYAIAVSDSGIGIADDQLTAIFDEFRQADDGTARKYGGTGLGLAIAAKYADLLGATIEVESVLGEGSTFTLRLESVDGSGEVVADAPAAEAAGMEEVRPARAAGPAPKDSGRGHRLLLVEDSEPAVVQLLDILRPEGYTVSVARNGREALACIAEEVPEALILDLMMPEVDGFAVLRAIREHERTRGIPVLILTAKHVTKDELSFLEGNGVHQLVQKGDVSRSRLLALVREMLGHGAAPAARAAGDGHNGHDGPPVVLLVEDDPDSRRTARALLGEKFRVLEAQNGLAGVERARSDPPDIILMDIAMPVMDGIQALEELRRDPATRDIPVVAVTASAMSGNKDAILAHGFNAYVSKPVDVAILFATLREILP